MKQQQPGHVENGSKVGNEGFALRGRDKTRTGTMDSQSPLHRNLDMEDILNRYTRGT